MNAARMPQAVEEAFRQKDFGAIGAWLDAGGNVHALNSVRQDALTMAVTGRHTELAADLLARGADPNARARDEGWTPFLYAISSGQADLVDLLLTHGADPNTTAAGTHALFETLMLSPDAGCPLAVRLLQAGADPRMKSFRNLDFLGEMDRLARWPVNGPGAPARLLRDRIVALRTQATLMARALDLAEALPEAGEPTARRARL